MKKLCVMIVMAAIILPTSSAFASAVVLDVRGEVSAIPPARVVEAVKSGMELPNGTVVEVKEGAVSLLLESGAVDELPSKTTYTVGAGAEKGKRTDLGSGITLAMRELSSSGQGPTVHGMVKEASGPRNIQLHAAGHHKTGLKGVFPVGTSVRLGSDITFSWSQPIDFSHALLIVDDARGKRLAMLKLSEGSREMTHASAKLHLKKGERYTWFLAAQAGSGVKGKTARFKFATLSDADERVLDAERSKIASLKLSDTGTKLLSAQAAFQHGLYKDMVDELQPLYEKTQAPFAKKLLRLGYLKMGNTSEAEKYK